jgi:hypothetical protein
VISKPEDSGTYKDHLKAADEARKGNKEAPALTVGRQEHGGHDLFLEGLSKENGYDAKPELVNKDQLDRHIADGDIEMYRGVKGQEFVDQFKHGDLFHGRGFHGNGTYTAGKEGKGDDGNLDKDYGLKVATDYAGGNKDHVMRMALKKGSKIISIDDVHKEISKLRDSLPKQDYSKRGKQTPEYYKAHDAMEVMRDPGRWAALHGYDAIHVHDEGNPSMGINRSTNYYVVLNRGALRVQHEATGVGAVESPKAAPPAAKAARP